MFLTATRLFHGELWAPVQGTTTTAVDLSLYTNLGVNVTESLVTKWAPKPGRVPGGFWTGNPPIPM